MDFFMTVASPALPFRTESSARLIIERSPESGEASAMRGGALIGGVGFARGIGTCVAYVIFGCLERRCLLSVAAALERLGVSSCLCRENAAASLESTATKTKAKKHVSG